MFNFSNKVYKIVSKIPKGRVMTYSQVAKMMGSPNAARAVGNILNKNRDFKTIPCHRVVRSDGKVGGYVGGSDDKARILRSEGIDILNNIIDLDKYKTA
jgi:methylated-DNA-[protein]-cysteine S-methyltransferase